MLRVLPFSPQFQNTVTLRGNVAESGRFAWHPGMKLSEIIPDSQALVTRDYWERRNQLGVPGPEFKAEYANNPDHIPGMRTAFKPALPRPTTVPGLYNSQAQSTREIRDTNQNYESKPTQNSNQNYNQNSTRPKLRPVLLQPI